MAEETTATRPAGGSTAARMVRLLTYPETVIALLLPVAILIGAHLSTRFLDLHFLLDSSSLYMETGIMALAMTFIIISGNIDLSVAANLCLTGVLCAELNTRYGLPMGLVMVLAPLIGGLLGLFNGLLISLMRLPSLTVTLGTLALYRGLAQVMVGDKAITQLPKWFVGIDRDARWIAGMPPPLIIFLAMAAACGLILARTTHGRRLVAIGTNEAAARFAGIRVSRFKLMLFVFSGAFAGVASMMMLSRLGSASYKMADGNELAVITAVVLGGTDILGGRGSIFGTVLALFLLGIVSTGMSMHDVRADNQLAITGGLLVAAVILFRLLRYFGSRRR